MAFITGATCGQRGSFAVRLAEAGEDIIGIDIGQVIPGLQYDLSNLDDLSEAAVFVDRINRRMHAYRQMAVTACCVYGNQEKCP